MTTAIIIPIWKRPKITRACFEILKKTDCLVFAGVSEEWAAELCQEFKFQYLDIVNDPLGQKKNTLLEYAMCWKWDQLMEVGSDNLLDLDKLDEYLSIPADHYGVNCSYMVDIPTKRSKFFKIGGLKRIWGAGRVVSREAVEKAFPLWDDKSNKYLDAQANNAFKKAGYDFSVVQEPIFAGLKSETNIHSYDRFGGEPVPMDFIINKYPQVENLLQN